MSVMHHLVTYGLFAVLMSGTPPTAAQVFKCKGADGRIEYGSKPCAGDTGTALPIAGGRAGAAARPAAPAPAAAPKPADIEAVPSGRRVDYFEAIRCQHARHTVEAARAELAEFEAGRVNGLVSVREQAVKGMVKGYGAVVTSCDQHPARWFKPDEGYRTQACGAEFAEFRRLVIAAARGDETSRMLAQKVQEQLGGMNCTAPR